MDAERVLPQPLELILAGQCRELELPVPLARAIVRVESGGDVYAWNPEPHYRYLWDVARRRPFRALSPEEARSEIPPADFPVLAGDRDAEWWGQQASWGPMQVMGAVAREQGFDRHFPALCATFEGLHYGCLHLSALRDRYLAKFGWRGVAAAYNAGSPRLAEDESFVNQVYVDKIVRAGGFAGPEER